MKAQRAVAILAVASAATAQTFDGFTVDVTQELGVIYNGESLSNGEQLPRPGTSQAHTVCPRPGIDDLAQRFSHSPTYHMLRETAVSRRVALRASS